MRPQGVIQDLRSRLVTRAQYRCQASTVRRCAFLASSGNDTSFNLIYRLRCWKGSPVRILKTLEDVGLGYIKIGQPAPTLSGREAQRIKLSRELARTDTGRTLYVLDEPTTGLHFEDIKRLLNVLDRLVEAGNTVLVIEHNLDVIKCADWIVDVGPEGGDKGGRIVATGTPEQVAQSKSSYTGQYLGKVLGRGRAA